RRYDYNHNGKIEVTGPGAELIVPAETVARIDLDKDGAFNAQEIQVLLGEGADVLLPIDFGVPARSAAAKVLRPSSELRVRRTIAGGYMIYLGDAQIVINRNNAKPTQNGGPNLRFSAFDTDQNGY